MRIVFMLALVASLFGAACSQDANPVAPSANVDVREGRGSCNGVYWSDDRTKGIYWSEQCAAEDEAAKARGIYWSE